MPAKANWLSIPRDGAKPTVVATIGLYGAFVLVCLEWMRTAVVYKLFPAAPLIACHTPTPAILPPSPFHSHCPLFPQFAARCSISSSICSPPFSGSQRAKAPDSHMLNYLIKIGTQKKYLVLSLNAKYIFFVFVLAPPPLPPPPPPLPPPPHPLSLFLTLCSSAPGAKACSGPGSIYKNSKLPLLWLTHSICYNKSPERK